MRKPMFENETCESVGLRATCNNCDRIIFEDENYLEQYIESGGYCKECNQIIKREEILRLFKKYNERTEGNDHIQAAIYLCQFYGTVQEVEKLTSLAGYQERNHHLTKSAQSTVNTITKPYFKRLQNDIKEPLYIEYFNNYLTLERLAEHYYTTVENIKWLFNDIWEEKKITIL